MADAPPTLDLALIGNCCISALIDGRGRIVWSCFPRFDGDPVFHALLGRPTDDAGDGMFEIELVDGVEFNQSYVGNTAVVRTIIEGPSGAIEIIDFAPRFKSLQRSFRPQTLVRRIRPLRGSPRIRIKAKPRYDYGRAAPLVAYGSNHIRYIGPSVALRLTTDAPIDYIVAETTFILDEPINLIFGPDETLTTGAAETARDFEERTTGYWREWVHRLALPLEWQDAVIRAAITLKLCSYEPTGAIVAAMTTSIPEAPGIDAQLGLPLLLDQGRLLCRARAEFARRRAHDGTLFPLDDEHRRRCPVGPHPAGLRHRAREGADRARGDGAAGISRHGAGARRQPGLQTVPARHLRQYHPRRIAGVLRPAAVHAGRVGRIHAPRDDRRAGIPAPRQARCRHVGIANTRSDRTPRPPSCAGPPATGSPRSRRISASPIAPTSGASAPIRSRRPCSNARGRDKRQAFVESFGGRASRCERAADGRGRLHRPEGSAIRFDRRRIEKMLARGPYHDALRGARRLRRAGDGLQCLRLLAARRTRARSAGASRRARSSRRLLAAAIR